MGRKNFYGNRSKLGTAVPSFFYTVFESAKLAKANPKAYLQYATLAKLRGEQPLLPHEWVKTLSAAHADQAAE